eukprot:EG_transcript_15607
MPERYLCPITTEIMVEPVMDFHGHNFERAAIAEWLGRSEECPLSREAIHLSALYPNLALKEEISEWLAHSHPMFAFQRTASDASSTTSVGEPLPSPSSPKETTAVKCAPWEKLDLKQDYYDQVMAVFTSFSSQVQLRPKLEALCRYMNCVEALGRLGELLPGDAPLPSVSFDDFLEFAHRYAPKPVLEYGLSQEEYATVLKKFQALDVAGEGQVRRAAVLPLAAGMGIEHSDLEPPASLPDVVTLHSFLLWCKRCRLLVARRSSVVSNAGTGAAKRLTFCMNDRSPPVSPRSIANPGRGVASSSPRAVSAASPGTATHHSRSRCLGRSPADGPLGARSPRHGPLTRGSSMPHLSALRTQPSAAVRAPPRPVPVSRGGPASPAAPAP